MKKATHILFASSLLILSACTEPGQTTAVSAAAGGAIGAGLGAIVGNQVGSTGAGIAIGAAGGAAAGAAIGNALEAQDKKLVAQSEVLKRRDEAIHAQRTEINELRKMNQDAPASSSAGDSYAWNGSTDGSGVRHASPEEIAAARQKMRQGGGAATTVSYAPSIAAAPEARAQMNSRTIAAAPSAVSAIQPAPSVGRPQPTLRKTGSVVERDLVTPPVQEIAADGSVTMVEEAPAPAFVPAESAAPALSAASLATAPEGADCTAGQSEIKKAEQVSDTADKLFHLRRALRMCPQNADYHNQLGELYRHLGRSDDAKFEFQEALKINPGHKNATQNLDKENNSGVKASNITKGVMANERY